MADFDTINYASLLDVCFEIEGLITLLRRREEEAPDEILTLLRSKVDTLRAQLYADESETTQPLDAPESDDQAIAEAAVAEEVADAEPDASETRIEEDEAAVEDEPEDAEGADKAPEEEPKPDGNDAEVMPSLFGEDEDIDYQEDEEDDTRTSSAGEKSLRALFSLNDKFRFRRELFGNSDAAFTDTINLLSAMHSLDEATEYLTGDLGWDPEADDVKAFMAIVSRHFNN